MIGREDWKKQNDEAWRKFVDGETTFVLDSSMWIGNLPDFHSTKYLLVQVWCFLDEEPKGFQIRTTGARRALKCLIPSATKVGDTLRVKQWSKSGKSLILEIVR